MIVMLSHKTKPSLSGDSHTASSKYGNTTDIVYITEETE